MTTNIDEVAAAARANLLAGRAWYDDGEPPNAADFAAAAELRGFAHLYPEPLSTADFLLFAGGADQPRRNPSGRTRHEPGFALESR